MYVITQSKINRMFEIQGEIIVFSKRKYTSKETRIYETKPSCLLTNKFDKFRQMHENLQILPII